MSHPHVAALEERHARLETAISQETARPSCDDLQVSELKRRKLALKDEIVSEQAAA